jgi:hypothetical protein
MPTDRKATGKSGAIGMNELEVGREGRREGRMGLAVGTGEACCSRVRGAVS